MKRWLQKNLINFIVRHLFHGLTSDDILVLNRKNGIITYRGKQITREGKVQLANSANAFMSSSLYRILLDELEHQANVKMFKSSNTDTDLLFGKAMLHNIGVVKAKMEEIASWK